MDRSGEFRKGIFALIVLLSLVLSGMVFFGAAPDSQAAKAEEKDDFGYFWMDNKDPDPKVDYNWIDARSTGTELSISYTDSYAPVILPGWEFSFYGTNYDTVYVGARGLIWFVDYFAAPTDYSNFPSGSEPNPSIAACYGYPYTTESSYGGVHYITGTDNIGRFVCIEWNSNSYGMTYEVILWDTGLIKMQYNNMGSQSSYSDGYYMNVGLENEDSSTTNVYSKYGVQRNLNSGLAIEFSTEYMTLANFDLTNGGGADEHIVFAEMDTYEFSFDVISSAQFGDISSVKVYFGPPSLNIFVSYNDIGGLRKWTPGGGGQFYEFDAENSTTDTKHLNNNSGINAKVYIKFLFGIPINGNISVTLWARGKTALPNIMLIEDAMYLDGIVKLKGNMKVYNERGNPIPNEAYTRESENITFSGIKLVYNSTGSISPPNSSFMFRMTDDELLDSFDMNVSGRNMSISYIMPTIAVRKVFTMALLYGNGDPFPAGKFISEFPGYAFRVDDSIPIAPASLVLRADSVKDKQGDVDNDDVIFISWSSVKDSGSGVAKYRIWTTYAPGVESIPYVDAKVTQYIWNGTTEGIFRVFVWAEDAVGHAGDWKEASIVIDKKDPYFVDFSPDPFDVPWLRTLTPDLTIGSKDNLTISDAISGVRPSTIEYSISTTGIDNFEEWISADLHDDENIKNIETISVKLRPRFVEGTENYIRYRAKDYAGNGYAYSDVYNLKIDVTPVAVQEFFPTPVVWHDLDVLLEREIECYLYDETSGILSNKIYYRISEGFDEETSTHTWVTGIPQQNGWEKLAARDWDRIDGDKLIYIHFKYEGFQEGDQNFIQFMFRDVAGNGDITPYEAFGDKMTTSKLYQININTQPVAAISEPQNFDHFYITDLITFDASESYDVDVDEGSLKFEWYCHELNKTIGYEDVIDTVRFPAKGWYNVTLFVGDSVHRLDPISGLDTRSSQKVLIFIDIFVVNKSDDDFDGMMDDWEWENFLTLGYDDSDEDADGDGYTNIQEYNARPQTDPMDKSSYPPPPPVPPVLKEDKPPFQFWLFMLILLAALIIAAVVVLFGYLRIHRQEQQEQTEEAEEEAMLATPQLDIPTMPPQVPMVDTSIPTLPAAEGEIPPQPMDQAPPEGQPIPEEQIPQPEDAPAPMEPPVPVPDQAPAPENPVYEQPATEGQNPMYQEPQ